MLIPHLSQDRLRKEDARRTTDRVFLPREKRLKHTKQKCDASSIEKIAAQSEHESHISLIRSLLYHTKKATSVLHSWNIIFARLVDRNLEVGVYLFFFRISSQSAEPGYTVY